MINGYSWFSGKVSEIEAPYNSTIGMLMSATILDDEKVFLKSHGNILRDKLSVLDDETQSYIRMIIELEMGIAYYNGYHQGMMVMKNVFPEARQYLIDKFAHAHNLFEKDYMSFEDWQANQIEDKESIEDEN